jgi:hypothetical protein
MARKLRHIQRRNERNVDTFLNIGEGYGLSVPHEPTLSAEIMHSAMVFCRTQVVLAT